MARHRTLHLIAATSLGAALAVASMARPASAVGEPAGSTTHCSAASYSPVRELSRSHQAARITYFHRLTIAAHSTKRDIHWSAPATSPVVARAKNRAGDTVSAAWIWHKVAKKFGQPVASGGHRTPRTEASSGTLSARNTTSHAHHDLEFNGVTRYHGDFSATRCADPNSHGVGHIRRSHGSWVTFGKFASSGLVQCGAGGSHNAITKAALSHCP